MRLTNKIVEDVSKSLGFDLVGFTKFTELNEEVEHLSEWQLNKFNAGMSYMERNLEKRKDVRLILPEAKNIISLGMNYYTGHEHSNAEDFGKVSRYAWGKDYHLIIWEKLDLLIQKLKEIDHTFEAKTYVDTGPVMDKAWAVRSGIGWLGKHSNVINRKMGSWFFIATVITNYDFAALPIINNFCGNCTACIDACPTNAIVQDFVVDANKCISYLTIENKGEIDKSLTGKFENWIFGCDICQEVCPWNKKFSSETKEKKFQPKEGNKEIALATVENMTEETFKQKFAESPILRTKLKGLKRNAEFLLKKKNESSS
ncbi:MAG: tRNA epoxyqueuosine(34) reductase QueG [Ignavibacteria bacterium CG22_combo_CG10-13_8_21_14_all_37_15]|nr:MAG: tRNA epoxyqueuosine(34) reductase QueG [Ignavibacteria bacterium CG22_combo_CG10-13_8_21_14_all_37_15]